MNLKSVATFLIILVLGGVSGFMIGKASKGLEKIDNCSISPNQFQGEIRALQDQFTALKQELAKKTGIIIKNSPVNTETVLAKANELIQQGQLGKAALYFSHALSQAPGDWDAIEHYQQTVLEYCQQLTQQGDYETTLNILSDMDIFMRSQATTINTQDIDKLANNLASIAAVRETVIAAQMTKNRQENTKFVNTLLIKIDQLLKQTPTPEISNISQYVDKLKDNILTLQSLDTSSFQKDELAKIKSRIGLLQTTIANFEQNLVAIQKQSVVSNLIEQTRSLIKKAKNEPTNSYLLLYYLNLADSLINQLVLSAPETEKLTTQVANLSKQLDLAKEKLAKARSQAIWDEIEKIRTEQLQITTDTKAQDAITKLVQLRQVFAEKASHLSSLEFLDQAKALREEIENALAEWQNKQVHRYNKWAIHRIKDLYQHHRDQLGAGTDEELVYSAIIDSLGAIDTRYLSTPAMTAYNEVFQKFYAELNDEQKISLSSKMTLMVKEPLSNF